MKHERCPFCGYRELRLSTILGNRVVCKTCLATGPETNGASVIGAAIAWDKWNDRVDPRLALMREMAGLMKQMVLNGADCDAYDRMRSLLNRYEEMEGVEINKDFIYMDYEKVNYKDILERKPKEGKG